MLTALAVAGAVAAHCSWDKPGNNRFTGDPAAAVDNYKDIPPSARAALKQRVKAHKYDEVAVITRDAVVGKQTYDAALTDMHFGPGKVCRTVSRAKWAPTDVERGLVYCESGHCIIVPTVCGNVSRVKVPATPPRRHALQAPPAADSARAGDKPFQVSEVSEAPVGPGLKPPAEAPLPAAPSPVSAAQHLSPAAEDASFSDVIGGRVGGPGGVFAIAFSVPVPGPVLSAPTAPVPEPASWGLLALGLGLLAARKKGGAA